MAPKGNKYAVGNKGGRPRKFKTVESMQKAIDRYFKETPFEHYTITGLALALDTTRDLLCDYNNIPEFSDAVKKAKTIVENSYEISLRENGRSGDIFALKNFGWKDKTEQEVTVHTSVADALREIDRNG